VEKVIIIAEAGVNHNGSLDIAMEQIDVALTAGADYVKFQTFVPEKLVSTFAKKAEYQAKRTGYDQSQLEMVRPLALSHGGFRLLAQRCKERGIKFMSTPFDETSLDFLVELGVDILKIGSGDLTNTPFLIKCARYRLPTILSCGMASLSEIRFALGALAIGFTSTSEQDLTIAKIHDAYATSQGRDVLNRYVTLMQCTTEYPVPDDEVNLLTIRAMAEAFGVPVGFSDHSVGTHLALGAIGCGARIVEKHFTTDKTLVGPDHAASLGPDQLNIFVQHIRSLERALGSPEKQATRSELKNREVARRSLVAAEAIQAGDRYSADNLTTKRPGSGVEPMFYWDYIGKIAKHDYLPDQLIEREYGGNL